MPQRSLWVRYCLSLWRRWRARRRGLRCRRVCARSRRGLAQFSAGASTITAKLRRSCCPSSSETVTSSGTAKANWSAASGRPVSRRNSLRMASACLSRASRGLNCFQERERLLPEGGQVDGGLAAGRVQGEPIVLPGRRKGSLPLAADGGKLHHQRLVHGGDADPRNTLNASGSGKSLSTLAGMRQNSKRFP